MSNGSQFMLDLRKFVDKANGNMDTATRKIVFECARRIVLRSPVGDPDMWKNPAPKGYVGGRFRANWQHGIGEIPNVLFREPDPSGDAALGRIAASIPDRAAGKVHYLVNNLPYAIPLENGWSAQAPGGMVGLVVVEFQAIVDQAAQEINP